MPYVKTHHKIVNGKVVTVKGHTRHYPVSRGGNYRGPKPKDKCPCGVCKED